MKIIVDAMGGDHGPPVVVGGKKVAPDVIVRSGFTAAIVCAVGLLAVVWRIAA